jgi:uncharacterized protein YsxB (DUF464 family)
VIRAKISLDREGRVLGFEAAGHAESAARGYDIVCAAFTVLARTAYGALKALPGIDVRGQAAEPGSLSFEVLSPAASVERAAGIADFLVRGMGDLAREYPGEVAFSIERDWEE